MKIAIKILLIVACVAQLIGAFVWTPAFFVSLVWSIPMTVVAFVRMDRNKPIWLAFKICTMLFVGLPAGICMLCDQNI